MALRIGGYQEAAGILGAKNAAVVRNWVWSERFDGLEKAVIRVGSRIVRFDLDKLEAMVRSNAFAPKTGKRKTRSRKGIKK
jgi:hypothetical protein